MGWPLGRMVKARPLNIKPEKVDLTLIEQEHGDMVR